MGEYSRGCSDSIAGVLEQFSIECRK